MVNLEWLRTFKAIYETGSLSAAAQTLFTSQPGVSLHLNSLESYTGYRLFEREPRRLKPTERGTMLYNYILSSLEKLEEAEHLYHRNSKAERPTVSVGMCYETFEYILEDHVADLPFNLIVRFGEYSQLIRDLDAGALDFILTPQRGSQPNLIYTPFTRERIILICGNKTDTEILDNLIIENERNEVKEWLKMQLWYATAADMEHLQNFWMNNFRCLPDFKVNYILPYFSSILHSLSEGNGFAVIPDFLVRQHIKDGSIKLAWEGDKPTENILYFGKRNKTIYANEITQLEDILKRNWVE